MLAFKTLEKAKYQQAKCLSSIFKPDDSSIDNFPTFNMPCVNFLEALLKNHLYIDAIRFLALLLPKRELIWWGCICARQSILSYSSDELTALETAEQWVHHPEEDLRLAAKSVADTLDFKSACCWIALAVFWSEGNMLSSDVSFVQAPDHLSAQAIAGAIMLTATSKDPHNINVIYEDFLIRGIHIIKGGNGKV